MKKKLIVLLALLTTGCSVNYNLVIEEDTLIETTTFDQEVNSFYTKDYMDSEYIQEYPIYYDEEFLYYSPTEKIEGNTYYEKSINRNANSYTATYKATYDFYNFKRSRLLNTAFNNFSIGYDNNEECYYIIANNIKIFKTNKYLTDITLNINLKDYKVIDSNQDAKNGTTYIWRFNRNDDDNNIVLKYQKKEETNDNKDIVNNNQENNINNYILYIFLGILLIVIIIGYFVFKKIKEKSDDINEDD